MINIVYGELLTVGVEHELARLLNDFPRPILDVLGQRFDDLLGERSHAQ